MGVPEIDVFLQKGTRFEIWDVPPFKYVPLQFGSGSFFRDPFHDPSLMPLTYSSAFD